MFIAGGGGTDWKMEPGKCKTQSEGDNVALMSYFGFLTRIVYYYVFLWRKERQARFSGSLNGILPWARQFCQSNKSSFMESWSPLHPGNEFLK